MEEMKQKIQKLSSRSFIVDMYVNSTTHEICISRKNKTFVAVENKIEKILEKKRKISREYFYSFMREDLKRFTRRLSCECQRRFISFKLEVETIFLRDRALRWCFTILSDLG